MNVISKLWGPKKGRATQHDALLSAQELLRDKINGDGQTVVYEYERLRRTDNATCRTAEKYENEKRNRYMNVLPFDQNRVKLMGSQNDYINASFIESKEGESPAWKYIATQGPLSSTVSDFWLMVYEQRSSVVLMLTRTIESKNVEKCASYFPEKEGGTERYGHFTLSNVRQTELDNDITARELLLTHDATGDVHKILHYHYHAWPDHGVPAATEPLRRLSQLLRTTRTDGVPIVHCSAGIGRTGTFCAIDIILRRLQHLDVKRDPHAAEKAVDVRRVVSQLRKQRVGMVQTPGQYLFCHQAVKEEIDDMLGVQDFSLTPAIAQSPVE